MRARTGNDNNENRERERERGGKTPQADTHSRDLNSVRPSIIPTVSIGSDRRDHLPQTLLAGGMAGAAAARGVPLHLPGRSDVCCRWRTGLHLPGLQADLQDLWHQGLLQGPARELAADIWGFMLGFGLYDLANGAFYKAFRSLRLWKRGLLGAPPRASPSPPHAAAACDHQDAGPGTPGYPVLYK